MNIIIIELNDEELNRIAEVNCLKKENEDDNILKINFYSRKIYVNKKEILLTKIEFDILSYLVANPGRVFTYQQIYESVWGEPYACEKNNIMTHISHLRNKIEPDPIHPQFIENVRGVGYRFKKQ